jgi:hypothetical protein
VRAVAGSGAQTLIVGFSVSGGNKPILLRGIGPSLAPLGVTGTLPDPYLTLYNGNTVLQTNDNWGGAAVAAAIAAFTGFPLPAGSKDAALLTNPLASGPYTAWVTDVTGGSGIALAEVYDADSTPASAQSVAAVSRLTSISARAPVGTGANIIIAGFAFNGNVPKTLLIRAVGPSLSQFPGVTGVLANPRLDLYQGSTVIYSNAGWGGSTTLSNAFTAVQAFPLTSSLDAALLVTLPPGTYTARVSGVNGTTGVALVEVYEMP